MNKITLLRNFGYIAVAEGISYLALFVITMHLKYWMDMPGPNIYVGYAHGALFLAYMVLAALASLRIKWSFTTFVLLFIASLLPFATFYVEKVFLRRELANLGG
jgi:integral membrane protein